MAEKQQDLSGSERAAIFLLSLNEKEAAEIMRHMPVGEVQRLGKAMASLRKVSRDQADNVLTHFTENVEGEGQFAARSTASLKRLLTSSLGEEKATNLEIVAVVVRGRPGDALGDHVDLDPELAAGEGFDVAHVLPA